jgi:hypothetical protein
MLFNGIPLRLASPLPMQDGGGNPLPVNAIRAYYVASPLTTKRLYVNDTPPAVVCNLGMT